MILWRISSHSTLDGRGGFSASGRWHTEGRRIVYLAENPAGALVEVLVHLELDPVHLPKSYRLLKAEAPEDLPVRTSAPSNYPATGSRTKSLRALSETSGWPPKALCYYEYRRSSCPKTFNVLLNPEHAEAGRVQVLWYEISVGCTTR